MNSEATKKINRTLTCNLTKNKKIVKPEKFQKLLELYGNEKKVESRFISAEVEKEARNPSIKFWIPFCIEIKKFSKSVKDIISPFKKSERKQKDFNDMDFKIRELCKEFSVPYKCVEYTESKDGRGPYINGMSVDMPFFGKFIITT